MNNSDSQVKNPAQQNAHPSQSVTSQPQGRVDIPGNNFQRPGIPAQMSRPAYPGASYPGAISPVSSGYGAQSRNNSDDDSRKLFIGQGITLSGEIEACDHLIVEGTIEATLKGANILDVAEAGSFYGTVEIETANISGRFEGDITVRGRLTVESTGIIVGTITYKELSIQAGATLDGSISPIGSQHINQNSNKKMPMKAKKVSGGGNELPFADRSAAE